ncbi:MAG: hypothetical protein H0W30_17780 [Gemmatimonadaceae bacterium]|nr:hypothetical protein [Gemmatimonadaceae bacterium]
MALVHLFAQICDEAHRAQHRLRRTSAAGLRRLRLAGTLSLKGARGLAIGAKERRSMRRMAGRGPEPGGPPAAPTYLWRPPGKALRA